MLEPVHPKRFLPAPPSLLSRCRILHLLESNTAKNCSWRAIAIWFLKNNFFTEKMAEHKALLLSICRGSGGGGGRGGAGGEALAATGVGLISVWQD